MKSMSFVMKLILLLLFFPLLTQNFMINGFGVFIKCFRFLILEAMTCHYLMNLKLHFQISKILGLLINLINIFHDFGYLNVRLIQFHLECLLDLLIQFKEAEFNDYLFFELAFILVQSSLTFTCYLAEVLVLKQELIQVLS